MTKLIQITTEYLESQGLSETFPERFWQKVQKTDGCWLWTAALMGGYGWIKKGSKKSHPILAHVASWILHFGPPPIGKYVLHNCPGGDNRRCVNPGHLWLGTRGENNRDKALKGRAPCKISFDDVHEIRRLYWSEDMKQKDIAALYKITPGWVSDIVNMNVRLINPQPKQFQ